MKNIYTTILTLLVLSIFSVNIYAQTTQQDIDNVLVNIEQERIKKLENQLALTLPLTTDNPNHIISFADNSKKGVKLEIDGQGYKTIKSPYTLPSLGIGRHILTFKFTDSEGAEQTLEKSITVVPRPPILLVPEKVSSNTITLKGTALASSTVNLYIASGTKNIRDSVEVQTDGTWIKSITGEFDYGVYSVVGYTSKTGIASAFSEPLVFEYKSDNGNSTTTKISKPIFFSFKDTIDQNPIEVLKSNLDLLILIISTLVLGAVVTSIINHLVNHRKNKKLESIFQNFLEKKDTKKDDKKNDTGKGLTLREKIALMQQNTPSVEAEKEEQKKEKAEVKEEKVEKEEEKTKEEEKKEDINDEIKEEVGEEKVVSKEEFLKEFKDQDPDNDKGEELKKEKKESILKKIKISLTSEKKK